MKIQELMEAKVKILSEDKSKDVMSVIVPFIQAGKRNQNGRFYPESLLKREISRVQGSVKRGSFIGTGDHPASGIENIATASHIVTKLSLDDKGKGVAELRILPTERGKAIQTLIKNDATLGVSVRGFGTVGKDGKVADDYKLVGLDVVLNPSEPTAVFDKSNIFESMNFEEEADENIEKQINELERESWLSACESGYSGSQEEWEAKYSGSLREMMGLPKAKGKTSNQKLTEGQINARMYSYFMEARSAGFTGSYAEWQEKYPKIVEQAKEKKVVVEKKEEPEKPFKSKATWEEIQLSGFRGTKAEYEEKFPDIKIIKPEAPKKPVVEKTLREQAGIIFTELMRDDPNSSIVLEDIIKLLEKEEIAKSDKRLRKRAIYVVNASLVGSGSVPTQEMLEKMVSEEIENLKEKRKEMREKNWAIYKKLLSD